MIIENCELFYTRLDPKRPNDYWSKKEKDPLKAIPTWEVQIRTSDRDVMQYWKSCGLNPKAKVPEDGSDVYFAVSLKKKAWYFERETNKKVEMTPPQVVDFDMNEVDPNTISNGSIANIRVVQRTRPDGTVMNFLEGVQLIKHIEYVPTASTQEDDEGFKPVKGVRIKSESSEETTTAKPKAKAPVEEDLDIDEEEIF